MFMYAAAYSFAKKMNRELLIDEETAFIKNKNIHKYSLNVFNFSSKTAPVNFKYLGLKGALKRKFLKFIDKFNTKKNFYIETKNFDKTSSYNEDLINFNLSNNLFLEGHFESEKYFISHFDQIRREFSFNKIASFIKNSFYNEIKNSNSVSICLRQNRFTEVLRNISKKDEEKSTIFVKDQINYINKCINIFKNKFSDPKFFLWSNDLSGLSEYFPENEFTYVNTNQIDCDLFLMSQAKHFIVIPSTYNWWGCWLASNNGKIVLRPSNDIFSNVQIGNKDFWPESWIKI